MNDEKLILLVEEHGELYDKRNPAYKLSSRKQMIWEQIGQQLGASGDTCMRRWTALRDRYGREMRKAEAPSGSGSQYYREWYLLDAMRFLKPHVVPRPVRFSLNVCPEASTSAQQISMSQPLLSPTQPLAPPSPSAVLLVPTLSSPQVSETVVHPSCSPAPSQHTTPQSLAVDVSPSSPSSPQSPSPSQTNKQPSRGSGNRKRGSTTDVASSMCEAIEVFKKRCLGVEQSENPAVEAFGRMIVSMVSKMTPLKQTRAMQRIMEVAFQVQQE